MASEPYYDIIVVGAGISGIGAGYHIQKYCPNKSFCILEGRETIGGTWDLFKYPGIRSDSSMETMGYSFKPWQGKQSISDGKYILQYMHETVEEYDLMKYIKCNHMLKEMHFDSVSCIWNLHVTQNQTQPMKVSTSNSTQLNMKCSFVLLCTGYYDYEAGYTPSFVGSHLFKGDIIHPQHWPEGFDYKNKRIAIIGSGATAVTLLPVLAQEAKHVTMVQRSPTYIASVPAADPFVYLTRSLFPKNIAGFLNRWYSILTNVLFYYVCVSFPKYTKSILQYLIKADVGCDNAYIQKHFNPKYDPWDQRLCVVPDSDMFHALKKDANGDCKASIITDKIVKFVEGGIVLENTHDVLECDVIITATGLQLKLCGGVEVFVDNEKVDFSKEVMYKGVLISNIPNAAVSVGYTNNTWTLKCDLTYEYFCKIINHMETNKFRKVIAKLDDNVVKQPIFNLSSGYIQRSQEQMPKMGTVYPWVYYQNYLWDILQLRFRSIIDQYISFE